MVVNNEVSSLIERKASKYFVFKQTQVSIPIIPQPTSKLIQISKDQTLIELNVKFMEHFLC